MTHLLNSPFLWNIFRKGLNLVFGLYRKRLALIRKFGLGSDLIVLDVGCGTGQYSRITENAYLGLDMDCRYIESAKKIYGGPDKRFMCQRLQDADLGNQVFDIALLIDLTHHINARDAESLFLSLSRVIRQYVVIADPVKQNRVNFWGRFLTALDRGSYIRTKEEEIALIRKYFEVETVYDTRIMGIEGVMIFAKPR